MRINTINNTTYKQNFNGAYIVKGTGKALRQFNEELRLQAAINPKFQEVLSYNLTGISSDSQPYAELLVCTGQHIENLRKNFIVEKMIQENKLKKFAQDFNSWPEEKKQKWREGIQEAVQQVEEGAVNNTRPEEQALANGNTDAFLNWYTKTIKESNEIYRNISILGYFPFPSKIRRLDAKQVMESLISNNFNIKEGFFRNFKNPPKVEIDDENGVSMRYINNKLDSVIHYKIISHPALPKDVKAIESYSKIKEDKNGKLTVAKKINFGFNTADGE